MAVAMAALALTLSSGAANACGPAATPSKPVPSPKFDLVVDGSWHYLNDHDVSIDIEKTISGPHLRHLTVEGAALGKDEIIVTCGAGPWRFFRDHWPDDGTYQGRFFLLKSQDGSYRVDHWVERGKEAAQ
jgi:hypothetical protein